MRALRPPPLHLWGWDGVTVLELPGLPAYWHLGSALREQLILEEWPLGGQGGCPGERRWG